LLIKYIKSVLWRVAKRLSYMEDARFLKVREDRHSATILIILALVFHIWNTQINCNIINTTDSKAENQGQAWKAHYASPVFYICLMYTINKNIFNADFRCQLLQCVWHFAYLAIFEKTRRILSGPCYIWHGQKFNALKTGVYLNYT
jgi:hypothetical protein